MFGLNFFYNTLINVGFTGLFRSSGDYGLSLILGGAEVTAWDLAKVYSNMAQRLLQIDTESYVVKDLNILDDASDNPLVNYSNSGISRAAIFDMIQAMKGTELPEEFSNRFYIENQRKIAWKTGTSFGFKDAWCVGITPEHTMVVWVGNSSGLGRPGLIGVYTAAPLLFELFQSLHESTKEWTVPYDEMHKVVVCRETGYPVSLNCDQKDTIFSASDLSGMSLCPYHISIYTDSLKKHRVFISCEPNAISMHWFNLPPVMEYYYKKSHPEYIPVPPLSKLCSKEAVSEKVIEFIYPDRGAEVFIPLDLDERMNKVILKATHSNTEANIYWFMDDTFLGVTMNGQHEWAIDPLPGTHYLKISDEQGRSAVAVLNCYRRNQQAITHKF
jgi:penicillin-binding protein 1C